VRTSSLTKMTIDSLIALREQADRLIKARAASERKTLEKQLSKLTGYVDGKAQRKRKGSSLKGRKIAAKYRNPANRSETWAGRGVRPRWLQAALKDGRSLEEFAIVRGTRRAKKRGGRKKLSARKMGSSRKIGSRRKRVSARKKPAIRNAATA
jgi:DNA-binding protein H-NS